MKWCIAGPCWHRTDLDKRILFKWNYIIKRKTHLIHKGGKNSIKTAGLSVKMREPCLKVLASQFYTYNLYAFDSTKMPVTPQKVVCCVWGACSRSTFFQSTSYCTTHNASVPSWASLQLNCTWYFAQLYCVCFPILILDNITEFKL